MMLCLFNMCLTFFQSRELFPMVCKEFEVWHLIANSRLGCYAQSFKNFADSLYGAGGAFGNFKVPSSHSKTVICKKVMSCIEALMILYDGNFNDRLYRCVKVIVDKVNQEYKKRKKDLENQKQKRKNFKMH